MTGEERLANKQNSSWKSPDFKRESYTKQILKTHTQRKVARAHTLFSRGPPQYLASGNFSRRLKA